MERKTRGDALRSLGAECARFEREFERMSKMQFAAVVIESTVAELLEPVPFSKMNGRAALRTLLGWSVKFGVPVYFAGSRELAESTTRALLEFYWRYRREGVVGRG
ncbi:MAG: hypothetical protein DHS20C21_01360 [Gemmatimonadota bacterium]|nr:MAG: hypothetical protein DHS20C21_01360 [Gemmatimonadota bacterium]